MYTLVLLRHGESTWNLENRFTGWTDVPLTPAGVVQAREAGRLLQDAGYDFDFACTSVLQRAIWTYSGSPPPRTSLACCTSPSR